MPEHYLKHKRDESDRAGYTVVEDSNRLPIFSYLSRRANNIIVRIRGTFNFVRGTVGGMFQFKKRTDTTTYATGENIGLININGDLYVRTNTADIFRIGNSGNIYVTRTIIMEGSTIDDFSTSLVATDPTANRIITFPDASGTVALTSDITGGVGTSGSPVDDDFAKFTDSNTIEGRSIAETKADLSLDNVENKSSATIRSEIVSGDIPNNAADTSGQAGTVATIAGLAPDTATTQATQPNITTMTGFLGGTANALITDDGDGTVTSESTLNYSSNKLTVSSSANSGEVSLGGTYTSGHPSAITNACGANILLEGTSIFTTAIPSIIKFNAASSATDQAAAYIEGAHANGTDKQGGDVIIVAGASTGNNASGSFKFWGDAGGGGSDSNVNAPTEKFSISGSGVVTTTNNIELGHASDTTIARSSAGTVTIEGEQVFTTNVPDLTSGAAGVPAVIMHTRRTITTAEANSMNTTPIELVPAQGANTVIIPIGGIIRAARAASQTNSAADLNMHYAGLAPGVYFSTSVAHARRFMYNETGNRIFHITPMLAAAEVGQNLSSDTNKALQVSFDSATTTDCFNSIDVFLTYQVISIA